MSLGGLGLQRRSRAPGERGPAADLPAGPARSPGGCARRACLSSRRSASVSCFAGGAQVTALDGVLARLYESSAGLAAGARGFRGRRALLLQRHAERVVRLAQLGIDLERLLERRDGARQIAALAQRLPELVLNAGVRRIAAATRAQVLAGRRPGRPSRAEPCPGSSARPGCSARARAPSGRPSTASAIIAALWPARSRGSCRPARIADPAPSPS